MTSRDVPCPECGSYFEYVTKENEIYCADCGAVKGVIVHTRLLHGFVQKGKVCDLKWQFLRLPKSKSEKKRCEKTLIWKR